MPKEGYGVAALVAAVLSAICLATYSGPYRLIADLQTRWVHTHFVAASFYLTTALFAVPLLGFLFLLEKRLGTRETWLTPVWDQIDQMFERPPGKWVLAGLVLILVGSYLAVKDLGRGQLVPLRTSELEKGMAPQSTYVELVEGRIVADSEYRIKVNSEVYRYLPVTSRSQPPVLFLRLSEGRNLPNSLAKVRGVLDINGMEGELRSHLEERGLIASRYYVLSVGVVPSAALGAGFAGFGLLVCIVGLVWWRFRYARAP